MSLALLFLILISGTATFAFARFFRKRFFYVENTTAPLTNLDVINLHALFIEKRSKHDHSQLIKGLESNPSERTYFTEVAENELAWLSKNLRMATSWSKITNTARVGERTRPPP